MMNTVLLFGQGLDKIQEDRVPEVVSDEEEEKPKKKKKEVIYKDRAANDH
jgi:hypothetical protein